jgi:hypothetical protein
MLSYARKRIAATVLTMLAPCDHYDTSQYFNFGNFSHDTCQEAHSGYGVFVSHMWQAHRTFYGRGRSPTDGLERRVSAGLGA